MASLLDYCKVADGEAALTVYETAPSANYPLRPLSHPRWRTSDAVMIDARVFIAERRMPSTSTLRLRMHDWSNRARNIPVAKSFLTERGFIIDSDQPLQSGSALSLWKADQFHSHSPCTLYQQEEVASDDAVAWTYAVKIARDMLASIEKDRECNDHD